MIDWCNANIGFMSAILSFASVLLSLVAIWFSFRIGMNQVKATVFDKKLDLFSEMNSIYKQCLRLSQIKLDASFNQKLFQSGCILFFQNEKEYDSLMLRADIARRIQNEEDDDEKEILYKQDAEIGDQRVDFIISVDENTDKLKVMLLKFSTPFLIRIIVRFADCRQYMLSSVGD